MFKIKFPTKRIFRIFPILRINGMVPFCNLFMKRPLYYSYMQFCYQFVCVSDFMQCISVDFRGIFVSPCTGQVQSSTIVALPFSYSCSNSLPEKNTSYYPHTILQQNL